MANKSDSKKSDTMALWNQVCETNPAITKRVNQRGGFTAIDAQSQIKRATELWGPFGSKWGFKDFRFDYIYGEDTNKVTGIALTGKFYYPNGQFPIASDMLYRPNDDCFKKLQTDCITKALNCRRTVLQKPYRGLDLILMCLKASLMIIDILNL